MSNQNSTELSTISQDLGGQMSSYCSFTATTPADKKKIFQWSTNPDKALSEVIGETLNVVHVIAEDVESPNSETGILRRIILIDDKGVAYACAAKGINNAIKRLFAAAGMPDTWEKPQKLKIRQITKGLNQILTFDWV